MEEKKRDGELGCINKLELLNEKLKQLARLMEEMKQGLRREVNG